MRLSLLAVLAALALPGAVSAGDCDAVLAAAKKLDGVPYRLHSETIAAEAGSEPEVADMIATAGKLYLGMDGDWQSVPRDMSGLGQIDDDLAGGAACRPLPDQELDGVATSVWAIDDASDAGVTGLTVWIAKASGLMVRAEQQVDQGVGDAGKSKVTMQLSYDNVTAPAGAD